MDEKQLDIKQIQEILDISYPTALAYAKEHGTLDPNGSSRGKWLVPASVVEAELESQKADIDKRLALI